MLNYPIIPIFIFVLLMAPVTAIGFFRGWKASLYLALINLSLIGIEIGIALSVYDHLWDLFKGFYIGGLQPGIPLDSLKEISKPSVVILFIGICMIPSYGITVALYFPIKKIFIRHLFPRTRKVNQNQKEINRNIHWSSRLGGVTISFTSSLFFASTATTAASTIFDKSTKATNFSKFSSAITNIYTFGQAKNNADLNSIRKFTKVDLTPEYQEYMKRILNVAGIDDETTVKSFQKISSGSFLNDFIKLTESPSATKLVIDILTRNETKTIYMMNENYVNIDEKFQPRTRTHATISKDKIIDLIAKFKLLPNLNWKLSNELAEYIISKNRERINPFEKTAWFERWDDQKKILNSFQKNLSDLKSKALTYDRDIKRSYIELKSLYSKINRLENNIKEYGKTFEQVSSTSRLSWNPSTNENAYSFVAPNHNSIRKIINSKGKVYVEQQKEDAMDKKLSTAQREFNDKEIAFVGAIGNSIGQGGISLIDYMNKAKVNEITNQIDQINSSIEYQNTKLKDSNLELSSKNLELTNIRKIINSLTIDQIPTIQQEISSLESQKIGMSNNERAKIQAELDAKQSKLNELKNELVSKRNREASLVQLVGNLTTSNSAIKISISHLRDQLQAQKTNLQSSQVAYNNFHNASFLPSQIDYEKYRALYNTQKNLYEKQRQHTNAVIEEKKDLISEIQKKIEERNSIIEKIYEIGDKLNLINNKNVGEHTGEIYKEGMDKPKVLEYREGSSQTPNYLKWANETIIGSNDIIKNLKTYLEKLWPIILQKRLEYNKLVEKYLEAIRKKIQN